MNVLKILFGMANNVFAMQYLLFCTIYFAKLKDRFGFFQVLSSIKFKIVQQVDYLIKTRISAFKNKKLAHSIKCLLLD